MPITRAITHTDMAPGVFATVGLPVARRVELWETHNATALIGLDVQASQPLIATEFNVHLPRVDLARSAVRPTWCGALRTSSNAAPPARSPSI